MTYLGELRRHWRALLAASLGVGTSLPLFAYTNSVFAPFLIKDFGWSRAQFALIGTTMLATLPFLMAIGRLTDRFGVRRMALIGTLLIFPCFIGYSLMQGSFLVYLVLFTFVLIVASMTGPLVYSRVVAENFDKAQGLAFTVIMSAPALLAIPVLPLLNWSIETIGWRTSYVVLGALCLVCGLVAVWLTPPERAAPHPVDAQAEAEIAVPFEGVRRGDYATILRAPVFWIVIVGMFLCLLQTQLHSSQMNLMLMDKGLTAQGAANIAPYYLTGTILGRIVCGLALDRFPTPVVTCLSMILPAGGFLVLGTHNDTHTVIAAAMFVIGLTVGAENDLISYLVARYFKTRIYNSTLGLLMTSSFLASAVGALAISYTLSRYNSFAPFLFVLSGAIVLGSLLLLTLPKSRDFEKVG
jgi:MFS family permease